MNTLHPRWNEGQVVGPRIGFEQSEVRQLAAQMNAAARLRERALLATGIDTMLRASDLLRLKVRDVTTTSGTIRESLLWRQQKTGGTVAPVLTPFAREALAAWIGASDKRPDDFLFTRRDHPHGPAISATTYRRMVKGWAAAIGLDPTHYSSHSIRRAKPIFMYRSGCPIADIARLLGHKSTDVTLHYLGITTEHLRLQALRYDVFGETARSVSACRQAEPGRLV